jgi:hypothetical protein
MKEDFFPKGVCPQLHGHPHGHARRDTYLRIQSRIPMVLALDMCKFESAKDTQIRTRARDLRVQSRFRKILPQIVQTWVERTSK